MKFRRVLVFALTVALAFAGGAGPRHAQAAVQKHHQASKAEQSGHSHGSAADHAHFDGAPGSKFSAEGTHDHAGSATQSDQGCCYAWCNSVAVMDAADWLFAAVAHDKPLALTRPFQIASLSSAIDPPPR